MNLLKQWLLNANLAELIVYHLASLWKLDPNNKLGNYLLFERNYAKQV